VSDAFAGKSLVQQQQLVYAAITPLMSGDAPPVHAIDRLRTRTA
jgi:stress-induced morphogen